MPIIFGILLSLIVVSALRLVIVADRNIINDAGQGGAFRDCFEMLIKTFLTRFVVVRNYQ